MGDGRSRVLIVGDTLEWRQIHARAVAGDPELRGVGLAGLDDALEMRRISRPDLIVLELCPGDRSQVILSVLLDSSCPVLVVPHGEAGAEASAITALEAGALDILPRTLSLSVARAALLTRIKEAAGAARSQSRRPPPTVRLTMPPEESPEAVAIGVSTGGPKALRAVLRPLPPNLPFCVLIVQHMPVGFTAALARRLREICPLPVAEAIFGEEVLPGRVYLAPAGRHMIVRGDGPARHIEFLDEAGIATVHRPAADVLMMSVAAAYGSRSLGVVLTGMGNDGTSGLQAIREAGGRTWAQDAASCAIYGMPRSAVENGVVDRIVRLDRMAEELARIGGRPCP